MSGPIERLRGADPAASLHLDERAEADLALLLDEPRATPPVAASRPRRRLAPILVTAVVALAVIALTAAVLGTVRPRTDVGGSTAPSGCAAGPFSCETYFSSGGTGSLAFLHTNLFRLTFERGDGSLTAVLVGRCNAVNVSMTPKGDAVDVTGNATTLMLCGGSAGTDDAAVTRFFSGTVPFRVDGSTVVFGSGATTATFTSDLGPCRPATSPFCGTYSARVGNGSVAFPSGSPVRLTFGESGSRTTATLRMLCATRTYVMTIDGAALRFRPLSVSHGHSCPYEANASDGRLDAFLRAGVTWRLGTGTLALDSAASGAASSATFSR